MTTSRGTSPSALLLRVGHHVTELRLDLRDGEELLFDIGGSHQIIVGLLRSSRNKNDASCRAMSTVRLDDDMRQAFESLEQHRLPAGHPPIDPDDIRDEMHADGTFDPKLVLWVSDLPPPMQEFVRSVEDELHDALVRTVLALRWRCAGVGPHQPFSGTRSEWSLDGVKWHRLPSDIRLDAEVRRAIRINDKTRLVC